MHYKRMAQYIFASMLLMASTAATAAQTCYYWVGYLAQPASQEYKVIFEKKVLTFKAKNYCGDMTNDLREKYVAFIKKNHPEYIQAYIANTDAKGAEFNVRAQATIQGTFTSVQAAKGSLESAIRDRQERYAKDPQRNAPVIVTDEFTYSP